MPTASPCMQNQAMQLAEVLASRSRTVADSLFSSGVVPPICAVLTACSIAAPAAAPAPGDTPAPDATAVLPPQLPHVLRALRALRYLAAASDGRRTAASDLLRHGAFQALCRLLVQAAAIADTDEGSVPEHAGSDEAMAKAAAVDAGCISDAQVRCCCWASAGMSACGLQHCCVEVVKALMWARRCGTGRVMPCAVLDDRSVRRTGQGCYTYVLRSAICWLPHSDTTGIRCRRWRCCACALPRRCHQSLQRCSCDYRASSSAGPL